MTIERDIQALRQVSIFAGLSEEQLRLLAFSAETVRLAANETLFQEADVAGSGFVVIEGQIQLFQNSARGRILVSSLGAGSVLNELALISETRRPATAVAASPSEVIKIRRPLFRRFIGEYPDIAVQLEARLRARLGETISHLKRAQVKLTP